MMIKEKAYELKNDLMVEYEIKSNCSVLEKFDGPQEYHLVEGKC